MDKYIWDNVELLSDMTRDQPARAPKNLENH